VPQKPVVVLAPVSAAQAARRRLAIAAATASQVASNASGVNPARPRAANRPYVRLPACSARGDEVISERRAVVGRGHRNGRPRQAGNALFRVAAGIKKFYDIGVFLCAASHRRRCGRRPLSDPRRLNDIYRSPFRVRRNLAVKRGRRLQRFAGVSRPQLPHLPLSGGGSTYERKSCCAD